MIPQTAFGGALPVWQSSSLTTPFNPDYSSNGRPGEQMLLVPELRSRSADTKKVKRRTVNRVRRV